MLGYAKRHWYGQQSLAWSFWFNLVLLRVLVFALQTSLSPTDGEDYRTYRDVILVAVFVFHGLLLLWQLVGVVRAADSHFSEHGTMALVWGSHLGAVLMFLLTAVYTLGAVQMTLKNAEKTDVLALMNDEHASRYSITLSADNYSLLIDGTIELGITRALKATLQQSPQVHTVILNSEGGNIYEGRGLARLIIDKQLDTHVDTLCASACIIAFSGGKVRSSSLRARFGFHQYRLEADYTIIATDVGKEQRRDQQLLLDAGVGTEFVQGVFSQPSASMWWPALEELQDAGFLHSFKSRPQH
ncbi:MAG: hypothetical protein AB8B87_04250 [Granulosicoccus sp.]